MRITVFNPPDPKPYFAQVYAWVRQIPAGQVASYGQIARLIPPPEGVDLLSYQRVSARWVGAAMRTAPDDVPWQRVINSQGKISLPPGSPSADEQRALLEGEGVAFDARGRVDLRRFGWRGPD
jgi:methylated-DNA-protein-cysteine methyltransferase-like protein